MNSVLWAIVNDLRNNGAIITDEDAEKVLQLCERKMDICKIENRKRYLPILYVDEIKNFLFRQYVNEKSMEIMRKRREEERQNVPGMQTVPMSSAMSERRRAAACL